MESICALCDQQMIHLEETVVLSQIDIKGINDAIKKRGDGTVVSVGQSVHKACRQNTKPQNIAKAAKRATDCSENVLYVHKK